MFYQKHKGKDWLVYCTKTVIVMDFASVASALLFLFVFLFDNSTSCRMQKTMHSYEQQEKVETLPVMSIPTPGYWPQEWDNERVERRNRRRTGWERGMGGWAKLSVLGHPSLSAIWSRWSEVLKINNLLDTASAKVWSHGPQLNDTWWIYFQTFLQSMSVPLL